MAKEILRDCYIEIDGADLSNRASAVTIEEPADEVDTSTFGGDYHEIDRGLKDATMTVSFFQDFAASSVDAVLGPLHESGEEFTVVVRPRKSDGMSDTNPERRMIGRLFNYSPLAGGVGEASTTDVTIRNASQAGITRHPS